MLDAPSQWRSSNPIPRSVVVVVVVGGGGGGVGGGGVVDGVVVGRVAAADRMDRRDSLRCEDASNLFLPEELLIQHAQYRYCESLSLVVIFLRVNQSFQNHPWNVCGCVHRTTIVDGGQHLLRKSATEWCWLPCMRSSLCF